MIQRLGKSAAAAILVVALSGLVSAPLAKADERSHCQHAVERAEARLHRAVRRSGPHSRFAEERRRELNSERQHCWEANHQWWNGREHRWETENNWEREREREHENH